MMKFASRYFMYTLGIISVRNAMKKEQQTIEVPSFRGVIEVVHKMEGRIRFRIPSLKGNKEGFAELESQINRITHITSVETNYITGTLLIKYGDDIEPTLIVGILIKLLGLEEQVQKQPHSKVTREFKTVQESLNLAIDEKTHGLLDLRSVFFLAFTTLGIIKIIQNPKIAPTGFTYLWWGYSMIKL